MKQGFLRMFRHALFCCLKSWNVDVCSNGGAVIIYPSLTPIIMFSFIAGATNLF